MAWVMYRNFKNGQLAGNDIHAECPVDFGTGGDPVFLMLLDSGSTIDQADVDVADVTAGGSDSEASGTNYIRKEITSIVDGVVSTNNVAITTAMADISYAQSAGGFSDAKYAVMFKSNHASVGSEADASCPVIASYTFDSSIGNVAGALSLDFTSSTLFTLA
jgi:hypothetical protein